MWYAVLKDFEKPIVDEAFYRVMQTCEYPPRLSNICNEIKRMQSATEKTVEELWQEVESVLPKVERTWERIPYNTEEWKDRLRNSISRMYRGLDEEIRLYIRSERELVTIACMEDRSFEKGRFFREMPVLRQHYKVKSSLSPEMIALITKVFEGKSVNLIEGEKE